MSNLQQQSLRVLRLKESISEAISKCCDCYPEITELEVQYALVSEATSIIGSGLKKEIGEVCENCSSVIEYGESHRDSEGVDLCNKCYEELQDEEI